MDPNTIVTQPVDIMNVPFPLLLPSAGSCGPKTMIVIDDADHDGQTRDP